jgi:hypothetical protein
LPIDRECSEKRRANQSDALKGSLEKKKLCEDSGESGGGRVGRKGLSSVVVGDRRSLGPNSSSSTLDPMPRI